MFKYINVPDDGEPIHFNENGKLIVPDNPVIPFIEGDGIGIDVTPEMIKVVNAAVEKAYGNEKLI